MFLRTSSSRLPVFVTAT